MRTRASVSVGLALAAMVAGCAQTPAPRLTPPLPSPYVRSTDPQFSERAAYVARAWEGLNEAWFHGFVPRQSLTVAVAPGELGDYKASAWAGQYQLATMATLPVEAPPDGVIAFDNREAMKVPLVTAARAYEQLTERKSLPCVGCPILTVTGATLSSVTMQTSRGQATVPAWLFSTAELSSPIGQVAVAPADTTVMPLINAPQGLLRLAAAGSVDVVNGPNIEYRASVSDCDQRDPQPQAWETATVVVLGASVKLAEAAVCSAIGVGPNVPMSVTLSRPLGERLVIDVLMGQPVPDHV